MRLARALHAYLSGLGLASSGKWFVLSSVVGLIAGFGAIAFHLLTQVGLHYALEGVAGYVVGEPAGEFLWFDSSHEGTLSFPLLFLTLFLGGLVSGVLVYSLAPEAEGHGTDAAIEAFHHKQGRIRGRVPLVKTIASAITIGTGGSGGREGPIAQIGAGFGSVLATRLGLSNRERRVLMAAGMGAGVGAIFKAPLAGALFASEILYSEAEFESDVIVPGVIAAIVAYLVYSFSLPASLRFVPLFGEGLNSATLQTPWELLPLALFAVVLVLTGVLYIKVFYGTHRLFDRLPVRKHFRPAIGALLAGCVAGAVFLGAGRDLRALAVLSTGYGAVQAALASPGGMGILLLVLIALGKILTTSLTISSGGSGGVFGPSMVIGGCMGAACGVLFHGWWPQLVPNPQAYVILGMVGMFAGCANTPISTLLMVFEMTGSYKLLAPTMWVATICYILCHRWTLYDKQVPSRIESPAHRGSFVIDVLEGMRVQDVLDAARTVVTVPVAMTLDEIVHKLLPETEQNYFPVVDGDGRMIGIFSSTDVRKFLYDGTLWNLAIAQDIMVGDFLSVTPEDDLNSALRRFTKKNIEELPVIDPANSGRLLGMLRRRDVINAYNQRMLAEKGQEEP